MKKFLGSLVAGAVLLLPTAASAATVSSGSTVDSTTAPIFVVGGSSGSGGSTVTPAVTDDDHGKPRPDKPDHSRHDGKNDGDHHPGAGQDQSGSGGQWQNDASEVHGGGMKFG